MDDIEKYLRSIPRKKSNAGVQIEFTLTEEGYRRLSDIAEALAKELPAFDMGQCLLLVVTVGSEVVEQRLATRRAILTTPN